MQACHHDRRPQAVAAEGNGHNINVSLFERLSKTLDVATLTTQWRMHPDIAAIPKLITYPELQNAPVCTTERPAVKGITNSRVVFIDHRQFEDSRDEMAASQSEAVSKTNTQ